MYWRRNLLFNTSNTGHRSPDIFYIFAELTLAALTFVGTGTAINIVVNTDTTTITLNGSKREEVGCNMMKDFFTDSAHGDCDCY